MFHTLIAAFITFSAFAQEAALIKQEPCFHSTNNRPMVPQRVAPPPMEAFGDWVQTCDGRLVRDENATRVQFPAPVNTLKATQPEKVIFPASVADGMTPAEAMWIFKGRVDLALCGKD